jgi:hypothetical protein
MSKLPKTLKKFSTNTNPTTKNTSDNCSIDAAIKTIPTSFTVPCYELTLDFGCLSVHAFFFIRRTFHRTWILEVDHCRHTELS